MSNSARPLSRQPAWARPAPARLRLASVLVLLDLDGLAALQLQPTHRQPHYSVNSQNDGHIDTIYAGRMQRAARARAKEVSSSINCNGDPNGNCKMRETPNKLPNKLSTSEQRRGRMQRAASSSAQPLFNAPNFRWADTGEAKERRRGRWRLRIDALLCTRALPAL